MRILHTADLHLSSKKLTTLAAIEILLNTAKNHNVDLVTIAGDIFDSDEEANKLRPKLRHLFSNLDFPIIGIPGNHDQRCYSDNLDFGSNFRIITNQLKSLDFGSVSIHALPYTSKLTSSLFSQLKQAVIPDKINILLLHCTLDIGFSSLDMGKEENKNYFPVSSSVLAELGYDYILAGHFHKETIIKDLGNNTIFAYPGSPCSITTKETGKRAAILLDTKTEIIERIPLETFYYDKLEVIIYPQTEHSKIEEIKTWLISHDMSNCNLEVNIKGFGQMSEREFNSLLSEISHENVRVINEYRDISNVLEHPLFQRFKELLNQKNFDNAQSIEKIVIEVFSSLLARGDIKLE